MQHRKNKHTVMRAHSYSPARSNGFTLIELVVTLALLGLLAMMAVPLMEVTQTRARETQLRQGLMEIRTALDRYKAASDAGQIAKPVGSAGYPERLDVLVEGVINSKDPNSARLYFLRRVPRDPFSSDPAVPASATWRLRAYDSSAEDPQEGRDVFDVASKSDRLGLNGVAYKDW
jgi:general secretion pathway protein G